MTFHPCPGPDDRPFEILVPCSPTPLSAWDDPSATATVVPGGPMPRAVGGVAIAPLAAAELRWEELAAAGPAFEEPPFHLMPGLAAAAGVVVEEPDGRVWVVAPSNGFGGYTNTFPKGRVDDGLSLRATALREAWEESGLLVQLTAHLVDCPRTLTMTRYYLARRIGGDPSTMGWESQAVHLVPRALLGAFLSHANDQSVLKALGAVVARRN